MEELIEEEKSEGGICDGVVKRVTDTLEDFRVALVFKEVLEVIFNGVKGDWGSVREKLGLEFEERIGEGLGEEDREVD